MELKKIFNEYIIDWEAKINSDEWYLYKFQEMVIKNLNAAEAFRIIPEVVELLLEQADKFLFTELFELLLALIKKTDTTEMPSGLESKWFIIESIMRDQDNYQKNLFQELKRWYRR